MASDFGKDLGLVHEVVVTGRKVGVGKEFWTALAENEKLFRRVSLLVEDQMRLKSDCERLTRLGVDLRVSVAEEEAIPIVQRFYEQLLEAISYPEANVSCLCLAFHLTPEQCDERRTAIDHVLGEGAAEAHKNGTSLRDLVIPKFKEVLTGLGLQGQLREYDFVVGTCARVEQRIAGVKEAIAYRARLADFLASQE